MVSKKSPPGGDRGLTIRELAERTGVPQATLRTWESRYGSPAPRRLPGGHRRYSTEDVAFVEEVLRQRAAGLELQSAVARAGTSTAAAEPSVFAGLRQRHPEIATQVLSKRSLLALTRAIEDECCARAARPVLFACFQRERFYQASHQRWAELSRTAERVVVFADFRDDDDEGPPTRVRLPHAAPLRREWLLVCDAPDYPACVAGWEVPGQDSIPDQARRFESLWTVDPQVVREAGRICARLARDFRPSLDLELDERLGSTPPSASQDLRRSLGLFNRTVGYLDAASR